MHETAQAAIEVIGMAIVLAGLLLIVLVTTYNRNVQTQDLLETNRDNSQCVQISSAISRMFNNRAGIKETIRISSETNLRRVEGQAGNINVGSASCSYLGAVQNSLGKKDTDTENPDGTGELVGLDLEAGTWCLEKQLNSGTVASQGECD